VSIFDDFVCVMMMSECVCGFLMMICVMMMMSWACRFLLMIVCDDE